VIFQSSTRPGVGRSACIRLAALRPDLYRPGGVRHHRPGRGPDWTPGRPDPAWAAGLAILLSAVARLVWRLGCGAIRVPRHKLCRDIFWVTGEENESVTAQTSSCVLWILIGVRWRSFLLVYSGRS